MMREQASNEPQLRHHGQRHSSSISRREAVDSGCGPGSKDCISDNKRTKSATQRPPAPYLSTSWAEVADYDQSSMSHTLREEDGVIEPGERYRLRIKAVNLFGDSDYSQEL